MYGTSTLISSNPSQRGQVINHTGHLSPLFQDRLPSSGIEGWEFLRCLSIASWRENFISQTMHTCIVPLEVAPEGAPR